MSSRGIFEVWEYIVFGMVAGGRGGGEVVVEGWLGWGHVAVRVK